MASSVFESMWTRLKSSCDVETFLLSKSEGVYGRLSLVVTSIGSDEALLPLAPIGNAWLGRLLADLLLLSVGGIIFVG
jgi:hypothetical protein